MHRLHLVGILALPLVLGPAVPQLTAGDCNGNGADDAAEIARGTSPDCNVNGVPDECELTQESLAFELPRVFPGGEAYSFLADDLDGDGDTDIATAGLDIRVLRNRGNGDFAVAEVYPLGDWQRWEVLGADLDGNGSTDLVAVCHSKADVPVLLNRGDGTFDLRVEALVPFGAMRPVLADIDGDGRTDLAATGARDIDRGSTRILGDIYWMRNRGDGSLERARILSPVEFAGKVLAADLDRDGAIDIAVNERSGGDEVEGETAVLLNRGDGTFLEASRYPVGLVPGTPLALRLDGDGALDLIMLNNASNTLSLLRNLGNGTYAAAETLSTAISGDSDKRLHAADLDGDGDEDLIVAGRKSGWTSPLELAVFLHRGDGTFQVTVNTDSAGYFHSLETADLTGDGLPEIVISLMYSTNTLVSVLENLGAGAFAPPRSFNNTMGGGEVEVRDFDGDLDLDIVTSGMGNPVTLLENATGAGQLRQGCASFLRGDVNADGAVSLSDMVMLRRALFEGQVISCMDAADLTDDESANVTDAAAILQVLFRNPDWTVAAPEPFPAAGPDPTAVAAVNAFHDESELDLDARIGCSRHDVSPAEETGDVIWLGDVEASPGAEVQVPVYITSSVPVEAVQLVIRHEPGVLEILPGSLSHERTFYEEAFPSSSSPSPEVSVLTVHPGAAVATAAIAGRLILADRPIPPGPDTLIAWIAVRVGEDVAPGSTLALEPTDGEDGLGVGPFRMRNEISFDGGARLVSTRPRLEGAILAIVGDQAYFRRADVNRDGKLDLSDPVDTLNALFIRSTPLPCADAADANDDGKVDVSDPIYTLGFLFLGGPSPPPPYPDAGPDSTPDELGCR